ncbi:hypothetical protein FKM82_008742 [Ascaphus truei]
MTARRRCPGPLYYCQQYHGHYVYWCLLILITARVDIHFRRRLQLIRKGRKKETLVLPILVTPCAVEGLLWLRFRDCLKQTEMQSS